MRVLLCVAVVFLSAFVDEAVSQSPPHDCDACSWCPDGQYCKQTHVELGANSQDIYQCVNGTCSSGCVAASGGFGTECCTNAFCDSDDLCQCTDLFTQADVTRCSLLGINVGQVLGPVGAIICGILSRL